METAREHLGLRGRQKIRNRDRLPVRLMSGGVRVVPKVDHPSALMMPRLTQPGFMLGMPPTNDLACGIFPIPSPTADDFHERVVKIGQPINLTRGLAAMDCYRFVAKMAHAFAIAELGLDGIASFLLNLIHGIEPTVAGYSVGSALVTEPPSQYLHEIGFGESLFDQDQNEHVVVRIRLFACRAGSPTHYAVVGIRPKPVTAHK